MRKTKIGTLIKVMIFSTIFDGQNVETRRVNLLVVYRLYTTRLFDGGVYNTGIFF
jgi:hypothetical protein